MTRWLPLLLISLPISLTTPAHAQEQREPVFLMIEEAAETEDELTAAMRGTMQRVGDAGQVVLTEVNPATNEGAVVFLLSDAPGAREAHEWARATQIDPRASRASLLIEAIGADGSPVGRPVAMDITLHELYALRTQPAKQRETLLGAMLRKRWATALNGTADNDALSPRVTPVLRMQAGGVAFQQPWFTQFVGSSGMLATQPFSEFDMNDVLGRTRRPKERIEAAKDGQPLRPLRAISDRLDRKLQSALVKARTDHTANNLVWAHLENLRSGPPRRLTETDTAFFEFLDRDPDAEPEQKTLVVEEKQGILKAGLRPLANE